MTTSKISNVFKYSYHQHKTFIRSEVKKHEKHKKCLYISLLMDSQNIQEKKLLRMAKWTLYLIF